MANIVHNKLVRDFIPEIIESTGKTCRTEILPDAVYLEMLDKKLNEEIAEYQESKSMEELADVIEVIRAIAIARGSSFDEIEAVRLEKAEKRGGFEKKILLVDIQE